MRSLCFPAPTAPLPLGPAFLLISVSARPARALSGRPVLTVPPESHELRGSLPSPETSRVREPPGLEVFQDSLSMSGVEERMCPQASLEACSVPKLIRIRPGCRSFLDPSSRARSL